MVRSSTLVAITTWLLAEGRTGSGFPEDQDAKLARMDCEDCMCWPGRRANCTIACQEQNLKAGSSVEDFRNLLLNIGPKCQVFADVIVSQDLSPDQWCESTVKNRPGWSFIFPSLNRDDFDALRVETLDFWVRLWMEDPNTWSCRLNDVDGYMGMETEYHPSKNFCPMMNLPEKSILRSYKKDVETLKVPLTLKLITRDNKLGIPNLQYDERNTTLDHRVYNIRYIPNGRKDGLACFGKIKGITAVRRIRAWWNGRQHSQHPYDADIGEVSLHTETVFPLTLPHTKTPPIYKPWEGGHRGDWDLDNEGWAAPE